ncbi:hypothetical protein Pan216_13060 [Planctomycetes bacterium Pan216]|uniref:Bacterial toxin 28 domain-containing protein n=1 Tax=Kolteria novifilia TaxID=2527975 RepID=A0A518B0H0_9BACT|nr:hypothetical protein Pan216_13060 [Planctomycetes bacterium Pan216]
MNDGASAKTLERPKRGRGRFAWVAFCLALAGSLFFAGIRSPQPTSANHTASLAVAAVTPEKLPTKAIEEVALGDRVVGTNPDRSEVEPTAEPDSKTWRHVTLWMTKGNGGRLDIELLRPLAWLEAQEATVGDTIHLDLEEMGAHGPAVITAIAPCPEIKPGDGNVVTGRFIHQAAGNIVDLRLANQSEATGVTDNHRYWSVDRKQFVPAGQLRRGETLDTLHGRTTVASVTSRPGNDTVYNLEVHNEHVYRVGTVGALVHNSYITTSYGRYVRRVDNYKHSLDPRHVKSAAREKAGEVVSRKESGVPYDHLTETRNDMASAKRHIVNIKKHLSDRNLSKANRAIIEGELGELSNLLDNAENILGELAR